MSNSINIDELNRVEGVNPRGGSTSTPDMKYYSNNEKWKINRDVMVELGMDDRGFQMFVGPGGMVILNSVPREEADFFRGKENAENKSEKFTARRLWNQVQETFSIEDEGIPEFAMNPTNIEGMDGEQFILEDWESHESSPIFENYTEPNDEEEEEEVDTTPEPADSIVENEEEDVTEYVHSNEDSEVEEPSFSGHTID